MMHYTTAQSLGRARIADLHHQARRDALARAARPPRAKAAVRAGRPRGRDCRHRLDSPSRAGAWEPVMAPADTPALQAPARVPRPGGP